MKQLNYVLSFLMVIFISASILMLSSTLVLRLSATYVYHFNDSQAVLDIPYSVTGSEMADGISKYLTSFSDESFQVYEDNGKYQDPLFNKTEQAVMKKYRNILNIELGLGMVMMGLFIAIYVHLLNRGSTLALRNRGRLSVGILTVFIIARVILVTIKAFRVWLYSSMIGIGLEKDSLMIQVLGDPMYKTYALFATVVAVVLTGIFAYVNASLTKQERIFY